MSHHPPTIRTVVVAPHPLIGQGLVRVLEQQGGIELVAELASPLPGLPGVAADVLVVHVIDADWPGSPVAWLTGVRRSHPNLQIVAVCAAEVALELSLAGALCTLTTSDSPECLLDAIQAAAAGQAYHSPTVDTYLDTVGAAHDRHRLTESDIQIIELLVQGWGTSQIAAHRCVASRTIQNRITLIRAKIGCRARGHIVAWYQAVYGRITGMAVLELPVRQPAAVALTNEREILDLPPRQPVPLLPAPERPMRDLPVHPAQAAEAGVLELPQRATVSALRPTDSCDAPRQERPRRPLRPAVCPGGPRRPASTPVEIPAPALLPALPSSRPAQSPEERIPTPGVHRPTPEAILLIASPVTGFRQELTLARMQHHNQRRSDYGRVAPVSHTALSTWYRQSPVLPHVPLLRPTLPRGDPAVHVLAVPGAMPCAMS